MSDRITASEGVYGFAAWLTTRDEPVTLGSNHGSAIAAELASKWCKANKLSPPRDGVFAGNITHPIEDV